MGDLKDGNGLNGGDGAVGFTLADGNGTTANGSKCDLGGDISNNTTINTLGFDVVFDDANNSINYGIQNASSGNKSFVANHTDSDYLHSIVNKLEGVAGAISNNYDINGLASFNTVNGDFVGNFTGVDNTSNEIITGMFYSDATNVYEIRLDINGLRVKFNSDLLLTIKPDGLINAPLPTYANDAAAGLGGLVSGDLYQTVTAGEGFVKIKQ